MVLYKSLESDGFALCFYHKFCLVIGKEVCQTVLFCLNFGRSFDTINDTNIVLIPKKKVSTRVIDFRPISLCIVIFKLVAKVLANRLK
jgi:hypothetical protein